MKRLGRIVVAAVLFCTILGGLTTAWAGKAQALRVVVDGSELTFSDAKPYIDDAGRTQVPLRAVAEGLGYGVAWEDETRAAYVFEVRDDGKAVKCLNFTIDSPTVGILTATGADFSVKDTMEELDYKITSYGEVTSYEMDTVTAVRDGRTYIPLSYVAKLLDKTVTWDGATYTVTITSNG